MGSAIQELRRATEGLPDDMAAASAFVASLYELSTDGFTDELFERLEDVVVDALHLLERSPEPEAIELIAKLKIALEGIQEGLPPNPANRPTGEQLAEEFAKHVRSLGF